MRACCFVAERTLYRRCLSTTRQGFGSFHSEDIQELINTPLAPTDCQRQFGELVDSVIESNNGQGSLGVEKAQTLFCADLENWTFLNHGAFGCALEPLLAEANLWRQHCERQPLRFYDRELFRLLAYSLQQMARFIKCPANELLPLQNVTSGLNSVFNSLAPAMKPNDEIVCLSLTYGSTKKMLSDLCARTGAKLKTVPLTLPVHGNKDVTDAICDCIIKGKTKLVVIDHITSNTAMVLPILSICQGIRKLSPETVVVVDAAHSLMSQEVSIYADTQPSIASVCDFWLTNGHKWFSAPKGCAFMWVSPSMTDRLRPAIISHGFQPAIDSSGRSGVHSAPHKLLSGFAWDGCRDYSSLLCVPSAIKLWESLPRLSQPHYSTDTGLKGSRAYMRWCLGEAVKILKREWQLEEADFAAPMAMRFYSPMALVPLPRSVAGIPDTRRNVSDNEAFMLQERLHHEHRIEVPVKCLEGRLYVRISAHIYNTPDQFERLAHAITDMK